MGKGVVIVEAWAGGASVAAKRQVYGRSANKLLRTIDNKGVGHEPSDDHEKGSYLSYPLQSG